MFELPTHVKIIEVGPRDGLQNETPFIPSAIKVELIDRLSMAGFQNIEAVSFVSPKWVPQMADGTEVIKSIKRHPNTIYSALTPNLRGAQAAIAAQVDEIVIFTSASERFAQRNINCSIQESIQRFEPVMALAKDHNIRVRGSISCAFVCPYEGDIPTQQLTDVARALDQLGCDEIDIADTIGAAQVRQVRQGFERLVRDIAHQKLSGHFHDTYGQALVNIYAAMQEGISIFHSSVAGLGGCPFAPGATGNVATEDVLYMMHGLGITTHIDLDQVLKTGQWITQTINKPNHSRAGRALSIKQQPSS